MRLAFLCSTRLVLTGLVAAATLAFTAGAALAQYPTTTISQSTFKHRCGQMGGTLDTGGTPKISICKLPSGQTVTCDFSTSPAICIVSRSSPAIEDMLTIPSVGMTLGDTSTKGPKAAVPGPDVIK